MTGDGAVLDACVLYPITLADTLLRLAGRGLFRPLWSGPILDETLAAFSRRQALDPGAVTRRFDAMTSSFPDALVPGSPPLPAEVVLPDPGDRRVVAAALHARARVVVTLNLRDFPDAALAPLGLRAVSPDAFLLGLLDVAPADVLDVIRTQVADTSRPPLDLPELLGRLGRAGAPGFAAAVATAARDRGR